MLLFQPPTYRAANQHANSYVQTGGPSAFAAALAGDSDTPELIWTHRMRGQRLVPQVRCAGCCVLTSEAIVGRREADLQGRQDQQGRYVDVA